MATSGKSTKKAASQATSKVTSRSLKSSKPRLLQVLVGLMLVLALVFLGTIGYTKWQDKQVKAKAAGAARIYNSNGWEFWVCQRSYPPASGAQVSVFAYKPYYTVNSIELLAVSTRDQAAQSIFSAAVTKVWRGNNTAATTEVAVPYNGWYRVAARLNDRLIHQSPMISINYTPKC